MQSLLDTPCPLPAEPCVSIVGLGPGRWEDLTLRAVQRLLSVQPLFIRMAVESHPVTVRLAEMGRGLISFQSIYLARLGYWERYRFMADIVVNAARLHGRAVFAVPGSPFVFERTSHMLVRRCRAEQIKLDLVGGVSSIDAIYAAIGVDPADNIQVVNAVRLIQDSVLFPEFACLILGLASPEIAAPVQEVLLQHYPADHHVVVVHAAGWSGPDEWRREATVVELLAAARELDETTSAYLPPYGSDFDFDDTEFVDRP